MTGISIGQSVEVTLLPKKHVHSVGPAAEEPVCNLFKFEAAEKVPRDVTTAKR
jgi:hypothetical protein